jgi:purine-nucleoside phosphorylase
MINPLEKVRTAAEFLQNQGYTQASLGIVLGTGLGNLATHIQVEKSISYAEIPHFPISTVESHAGKLLYGTLMGKKVLAMQGRFHFYEGYSMEEIVLPIRVMKLLGIEHLFLSNAAGLLNMEWNKGDLMLLDDHINLLPTNPLIGKNIAELGPRFPDMSAPYDFGLNQSLLQVAKENGIKLRKGVYASMPGPMLETRAEYRYLQRIGADAIGMSTVPEVIAAVHMGMKVAAISVLTDECNPDHLKPAKLEDILAVAAVSEIDLSKLVCAWIAQL